MRKVMVSDKDPLMLLAFKTILSHHPQYKLQGKQFLPADLQKISKDEIPDLLFISITEKEIGIVEHFHAAYPCVAIYVMTFCESVTFLKRLLQLGVKGYLLKPISVSGIHTILHKQDESIYRGYSEKIFQLVRQKAFDQIHQTVKSLSDDMMQVYQEHAELVTEEVLLMVSDVLQLMNYSNTKKKEGMLKRFRVTDRLFEEKYRLRFFLFQLIDELFKHQSIARFPNLVPFYLYIEENIFENISLSDVAEVCHISQGYLSRLIKTCYTVGFNTYIQYRKIEMAKQLFYYQDEKIIDVAFQLSYSESSYFCKVFRRIEGVSPMNIKKDMEMDKNRIARKVESKIK